MTAPLNKHIHSHLIEMVKEKLLLERITLNGVDVNIRDEEGKSALFWAIKKKSTHNANLLISFGSSLMVDDHTHALFHALDNGHHEILVLLIERGIDVNTIDDSGKTLLMAAIEAESFESVKYLLSKDADMYILDHALNMAEDYAKRCNSELIESYMKHMIYSDMKDNNCPTQCKCG